MINKHHVEATVTLHRIVESNNIQGDFHVVRMTQSGEMSKNSKCFNSVLAKKITTGIVDSVNLKRLLEDEAFTTEQLSVASPTILKTIQKYGYVFDRKVLPHLAEKTNLMLSSMEMEPDDKLVRLDYSSHMLFDPEGGVLPVGIYYDYMTGMMSNGSYDLNKVRDLLKQNDQVHSGNVDSLGVEKPIEIELVPYYNTASNCSTGIGFWFAPTQAQMKTIWEKAKTLNSKCPSCELHRAVFELDMLGLRKQGAALFDFYYGCEDAVDNDEDDNY